MQQEFIKTHISKPRRIRKITSNNKSGDAYGITIPRWIAQKYRGYFFEVNIQNECIILTISGAFIGGI